MYLSSQSLETAELSSFQSIFGPMSHRFTQTHTHEPFTIPFIVGPTYASLFDRVIHRPWTLTNQNHQSKPPYASVCIPIYQATAAAAAAEVALEATVKANTAAAAAAAISAEVVRLRCVPITKKKSGEWDSDALVYKRNDSTEYWERDH